MALLVEDGSGLVGAESYISVIEADLYFSSTGITIWATQTETEKEQALRRAVGFMQRYRGRWKGSRNSVSQSLDWPRSNVFMTDYATTVLFPNNSVPTEVKNACAELALRASIAALSEDKTRTVLQETVGPVTVKYDQFGSTETQYTQVNTMLSPYLNSSGGGMMKLSRC